MAEKGGPMRALRAKGAETVAEISGSTDRQSAVRLLACIDAAGSPDRSDQWGPDVVVTLHAQSRRHRQLVAVGREERRDAGIGCNHAAIATPVTSAQCVNAWVRTERMSVAVAGGGREKTLAI